ncbi:MAG TPA: response regulator transcription factor [Steroidobacteraceae bacterium]|nr:response regulator transcription factor [Steroidobacteraceae bacterium]
MLTTVFVADDHAIVRDGLTTLLAAQQDMQVVGAAANGREAVVEVLRLAPRVAILDISMPELDGIEATRQILAANEAVHVMILSMHAGAQHVFHALEAGVRGYLLKESASREVIEAVRIVQSGRRYLSPRVAEIVAQGVGDRRGVSPLNSLSRREREILKLVADGHSSAKIGALLHLSPKTVDTYRSRMMQKLHVSDLAGVIKLAIQHGLTTLE